MLILDFIQLSFDHCGVPKVPFPYPIDIRQKVVARALKILGWRLFGIVPLTVRIDLLGLERA